MDSKTVKIVAGMMVALALLMGIFAYQTSKNLTQAPPDVALEPVDAPAPVQAATLGVVAVKPIRAHQVIKPEDVELHPLAVMPPNYFEDMSAVVGRAPLADIDVGVPLTARYFGNVSPLAQSIPPNHKAIALRIDEVVAVGSFVRPGDIVDVLLYVRGGRSGATESVTQSRVLLHEARVLAFEEQLLQPPVQPAEGEDNTPRRGTARRIQTVVVAVPQVDVTRVMLGASLGELRLALHGASGGTADLLHAESTFGDVRPRLASYSEPEVVTRFSRGDDQVITLKELTALQSGPRTRGSGRTRAARSAGSSQVIVHRGTETHRVSYDGKTLK